MLARARPAAAAARGLARAAHGTGAPPLADAQLLGMVLRASAWRADAAGALAKTFDFKDARAADTFSARGAAGGRAGGGARGGARVCRSAHACAARARASARALHASTTRAPLNAPPSPAVADLQLRTGAFPLRRAAPTTVEVTARIGAPPGGAVTQAELDAALAADKLAAELQLGGGWG